MADDKKPDTSSAPAATPPGTVPTTIPPGMVPIAPDTVFWQSLFNPAIGKFYANTFSLILHPTDLAVLFGQAGAPGGIISMNYSVAKTLAARLQDAVSQYEKSTGMQVSAAEALEQKFRDKPPGKS